MLKIACTMLALGAGGMLPERAAAQAWPSRPIMLVVPYAPGGNVDIAARVFAKELSSKLGQQVVIENKSGAGGIVGSVAVAKARPDGYTLLLTAAGPAALNKLLYKSIPYDTETEFTPIVVTNDVPQVLVVSPKLGIVTLKQLVDYARQKDLGYARACLPRNHRPSCVSVVSGANQDGCGAGSISRRGSAHLRRSRWSNRRRLPILRPRRSRPSRRWA